ncbi:putative serine/threonine-protein phosphatase [Streptomyces sp. NBRC 110611]|uniref:PP2C family protein-serine/threonine phosphatase n=1 Tax=Streptomyces sp. NBRC 110611 TaxID=1621259 RepID=UPI000836667F|nr:PP2C family protein-serine/threonine phosphatase [Streptomyces sp. NBRC 110611]GAU66856.1 putative serine/threonine-protein phosphatase [Streptomyces sp. NBRC 110611]
MTAPHVPKVAGIEPALPAPTHTVGPHPEDPHPENAPADHAEHAEHTADSSSGPSSGSASDSSSGCSGTSDGSPDGSVDGPGGGSSDAPNGGRGGAPGPVSGLSPDVSALDQLAAVQDRLAGWISDLSTLHDLTEQLARTRTLEEALHELLRAGAALVGARRGLVVLAPADGLGPETTVGLGLGHAEIGHIETVPRRALSYARILDGLPEPGTTGDGTPATCDTGATCDACDVREISEPDIPGEKDLDPRLREVAARLGYAASYAVPLTADPIGRTGAAVWLYDEPAAPTKRQRHLIGLYRAHAAEHLARLLELHRSRQAAATLREELLPHRLPRVPGVRLAVRHSTGPRGGGDWYDALPLPDGALGLAVGSVTGSGPSAVAAMGRLRASLRAYAVMEGEDPVAVLSDLELLLRLTEPARSATALFAFTEPPPGASDGTPEGALGGVSEGALSGVPEGALGGVPGGALTSRKLVLAGAGHCPPLILGDLRTEFVETSLSAPLGMLACWEAPSVEIEPAGGETLLLYSDGLLHRTGEPMDRAFARLHTAAASIPRSSRRDPEAVVDHIVRAMLPQGLDDPSSEEDVVLLATYFEE